MQGRHAADGDFHPSARSAHHSEPAESDRFGQLVRGASEYSFVEKAQRLLFEGSSYFHRHFLLIEVSDTSLRYDRGRKLPKYTEAGVSEVWIVNLQNMTIEQNRDPEGKAFSRKTIFQRGDSIAVAALPEETFKSKS